MGSVEEMAPRAGDGFSAARELAQSFLLIGSMLAAIGSLLGAGLLAVRVIGG